MNKELEIHLSDFQVALGPVVAVADLVDADVVAHRSALDGPGQEFAAVSSEPSVSMAAKLLGNVRDTAGIIYVAENLEGTPSATIEALLRLSNHRQTPAYIVTGTNCANLGAALLGAATQCRISGPVTIVTADRARPDNRISTDSMSLLGDAASTCRVTHEYPDQASFEVVTLQTSTQVPPAAHPPALAELRSTLAGVREATRTTLDTAGWSTKDVAGMLVGEFSTASRRFLASASGIPQQFFPRTKAGHCFCTDLLRGLADLSNSGDLSDGTRIIALASGRSSWSAVALRYRY
jgi:hypothetical protein